MIVKMGSSSPIFEVKIKKYLSCHHLDNYQPIFSNVQTAKLRMLDQTGNLGCLAQQNPTTGSQRQALHFSWRATFSGCTTCTVGTPQHRQSRQSEGQHGARSFWMSCSWINSFRIQLGSSFFLLCRLAL